MLGSLIFEGLLGIISENLITMRLLRYALLFGCLLFVLGGYCQESDSSFSTLKNLPVKYYSSVNKKLTSINKRLTSQSLRYLSKFSKQDAKFQQILKRYSPNAALSQMDSRVSKLTQRIKSKTGFLSRITGGTYNAYMDSLGSSLKFLKQFKSLDGSVEGPLASYNELEGKLQASSAIENFVNERKQQLQQILSGLSNVPGPLKHEFDNLNKTTYYYSAQVNEYKNMLKDPDKIEQKALGILEQLPAFQKFIKENGQLAWLFRLNQNMSPAQSLAGLQTQTAIQRIMQRQMASGGSNARGEVQQNISNAINQLNQFKSKVNAVGGGGSDLKIPDFKPNSQKTKSLLQRLEYTFNIQFNRSSSIVPNSANLALGVGYKLNDKSTIGVAMSYKMGAGTLQHLSFTSQGLGLRSYLDWKIKREFYVSGGYELNYNSIFKNIQQLKTYNLWQRSALLGLTKKYAIKKKLHGEMQVLYDFLAYQHIPGSQPFIFRIGYSFK